MAQTRPDSPGMPRSLNNDTPTYVKFINDTRRTVDLFWIGYDGKLTRYGHIPPRKGTAMNTYVTHPWVARDAVTWYPLLLNGGQMFHPEAERGGQVFHNGFRDTVVIHIPVFPLYRRCLEIVHLFYKRDVLIQSNIPKHLKEMALTMSTGPDYRNYRKFNTVHYEDYDQNLGEEVDVQGDEDHNNV